MVQIELPQAANLEPTLSVISNGQESFPRLNLHTGPPA